MLIAGMIVGGIGMLFCILGLIFWLFGISPYTAETQGKVVGMCLNAHSFNNGGTGNNTAFISSGSSGGGTRCPVIEYIIDGVTYVRAGRTAYNHETIRRMMDRPRTVYYNPKKPGQVSLTKKKALNIVGKVFMTVGIIMIVLAVILFAFT